MLLLACVGIGLATGLLIGMFSRATLPERSNLSVLLASVVGAFGGLAGGLLGRALFHFGGRSGSGGMISQPSPVMEIMLASGVAAVGVLIYLLTMRKRRVGSRVPR